jgi:uncharacterized protein YndB with AHSA1/START domain
MAPATHNTFIIERRYAATPARLFAAFADPAQKRRWFVEGDHHDVQRHDLDFQVGGREVAEFRLTAGPVANATFTVESVYLDIVAESRIVFACAMTMGGARISASLVTVELSPDAGHTRLLLTHQSAFFEGADGPVLRELGWLILLDRLADHATHATA